MYTRPNRGTREIWHFLPYLASNSPEPKSGGGQNSTKNMQNVTWRGYKFLSESGIFF